MTPAHTNTDIDQLLTRLPTSDLADQDIDSIRDLVEQLCSDYSTEDPDQLKARTETALANVDGLLAGRLTLADHQAVLEQAGWLALLLAALAYDIGRPDTAEQARQAALAIGHDLHNRSILGWAHETTVWIEIANANWSEARNKASAGLDIAGTAEPTGVAIQLALQQSEASARMGDIDSMNDALRRARQLLAEHEPPTNPKNHFRFDHAKFDLREMRTLLIVGQDHQAEQIAVRLYDELQNPDGSSKHPMRTSEILASRGLIEARRGNIDQAVDYANQAIEIGRRSRLSFQQITAAVTDELSKHKDRPIVRRFLDHRADLLQIGH